MRALITGGGGFCGRHLIPYLEGEGVEVHTMSRRGLDRACHHQLPDITDMEAIRRVLEQVMPDYVFHLAGVTHTQNPALFYRVNCEYAAAILSAITELPLKACPVLLVGTCAEYGMVSQQDLPISETLFPRPYNHYGISKLAQTLQGLALSRGGHPVVMVRPFNAIGPGMSESLVVQSFARQIVDIKRGKIPPIIEVGNLASSRDFVAVEDLVKIYWMLLQRPSAYGEIVNVCSGKRTVIRQLLDRLIKKSGVEVEVRVNPSRLKQIDVPEHYGSIQKLQRIVGYVPETSLDVALDRILDDLQRRP